MYNTMQEFKNAMVMRAARELSYKSGAYISTDERCMLEDYFDDAVEAIRGWRKLKPGNDSSFLSGEHNSRISKYIIRVFQELGIEGQKSSNVGGDSKTFDTTPRQELLSDLTQII